MNPLDFINLTTISIAIMFISALGLIALVKPVDKIIMLSLLEGGFFLTLVSTKYLDVALVVAFFQLISTVIIIVAVIKINDIRRVKGENEIVRN